MTISTGTAAFIGRSPAACATRAQMAAFAATDSSVLLTGPSGCGKELVARGIRDLSVRRDRAFVAVDCGALAESLAESELFGHAPGAYTGATSRRRGLFIEASGGTLFLDEIGNASPQLQARLLRALESREVRPVGADRAVAVDVRIIAATNVDLVAETRAGRFRADLLYRLNVLPLVVPSLDDRREDIPELAAALLARLEARTGVPCVLSDTALRALCARPWPGNVRELRNALERGYALARGGVIEVEHLPAPLEVAGPMARHAPSWKAWHAAQERAFLLEALEANGWNRSATARQIGLSRQALFERLRKHDLRPRLVSPEPSRPVLVAMAPPARHGAG